MVLKVLLRVLELEQYFHLGCYLIGYGEHGIEFCFEGLFVKRKRKKKRELELVWSNPEMRSNRLGNLKKRGKDNLFIYLFFGVLNLRVKKQFNNVGEGIGKRLNGFIFF